MFSNEILYDLYHIGELMSQTFLKVTTKLFNIGIL
jgi:hypothetical protein